MKRITVENYRKDVHYPRVVRAVEEILKDGNGVVATVEVFIRMGLLTREKLEDWRLGRVRYLERVLLGNLSKLSRILRILRMHAYDLKLAPSEVDYRQRGEGPKRRLRFSKTGVNAIERAYSLHFVVLGKERKPKERARRPRDPAVRQKT